MPPAHSTKPHQTYSELTTLLQKRGMTIPDEERAKRKLSQIGYYRLSGFWYPCRKVKVDAAGECVMDAKGKHPLRGDDFQEGTNFDSIIDLYLFDKLQRA